MKNSVHNLSSSRSYLFYFCALFCLTFLIPTSIFTDGFQCSTIPLVLQNNRYISFVWKINPIKERYQVYTFDKSVSFKSFFFFHFSPYLSLSLPLKSILTPYTPLRLQQRSTRITETTAMTQRSTDYFPIFSENDTCSTQTAPPLNVKMSLIPLLQILYLYLSFWLEHPWVSACFLTCFCCNNTQFNWWHFLHLFALHQPSFGTHIKNIHWVMHGAKSLLLIPSASMQKSCQRLVMVRLRTHLNSLNTGL